MNHKVYLSLGSNMGNRENYLISALNLICKIDNVRLVNISGIYETDPVGYADQDRFLNMTALINTSLDPEVLLTELQRVENLLKRKREIRWGPRTIDIDMLLYDDLTLDTPELIIPHPRMFERAFVLVPLKEICSEKKIFGIIIDEAIKKCSDRNGIKLYKKISICDFLRI
ncbi:MAG TPA: 2-amino-4-hydroxy-6-hydroxymethyldihydropteridine diphosphokinase [Acetivibrio sp.]|nr:2-amino-4-hydroxy-6-hydroxymethyldihydropteridine diphosphokinase [Clostridium sp.]HOQ38146.1 2-amino-4-hydroxy-6-hydroxymethyldihydropteridine diphosphokinase [Acetivibrio sp.]HPT91882.1 2-amino-4-hydroxy-6-hydroxymethyldihydropteridine diphosphokinase [Acetivibrio sp.]HQA58646.1 2-amino-4-hydroxy-6-hydroxymethyldihydropteridine diphosphokinase [Acetivibrio sp.]